MLYLRVKKADAEKTRIKLLEERQMDPNFEIFSDQECVYFPVLNPSKGMGDIVDVEGITRKRKKTPYELIVEKLHIDENLKKLVPKKWEKFGNVVLLQLPQELYSFRFHIGKTFAEILSVKSVLLYRGVKGEFRKPVVEFIFGNDAITTHLENGILYKFDASRIMFSSGNVDERIRMSKIDALDEVVLDMFAGIGYFSIPVAKYCQPSKVIAIEKNEESYKYLVENAKINGVHLDAILSDNREVEIREYADRVIMGYFHTSEFVPYALKMMKHKGIIHYHDTWRKEEVIEKDEILKSIFGDLQYQVLRFHVVKNYAPNILHVSVDIRIRKV